MTLPILIGRGAVSISPDQLAQIPPFHIDGFAGGGGASEGYYLATGRHADMAWNHDREALAMHRANHPFTKHFREDIRRVKWKQVIRQLVTSAHFSPDCKDFSKAKGGKPKSKRIRGLAWTIIHMINELGAFAPLLLTMENVEEFAEWCPLLPDGTRNQKLLGWFFRCFVGALQRRGYVVEFRELRACDYSRAPTIRKRLYIIARRDGQPIVWPQHLFGEGKPHRQGIAADILDFDLPCPSIFMSRREARTYTRRTGIKIQRPLARNSLKRFADGVGRYVIGAKDPFIVCLTHEGNDGVESVRDPAKTVTGATRGERSLVVPLLARQQHGGGIRGIDVPAHTMTASPKDQNQLLCATLVGLGGRAAQSRPRGADEPLPTLTAKADGALVSVFLAQNNGGMVGHRVDEPVSTISAKGSNQSLVVVGYAKYYGNEDEGRGVREPVGTVTTKERFGLFEAQLEVPVLTPQLADKARRVARFLRKHGVKVEGEFALCGELVIVDIGMRMLTARELYRAQGFGEDYIIDRGWDIDEETGRTFEIKLSKTAQVKMCGNSVCPPMAEVLFRLNLPQGYLMKEAA